MDSYLGQVMLFAFNYAPKGWLACQGQLLPMAANEAVFALLGTTYGGDGRSNFGVPDLRGKEPAPGLQYCICISGLWPPRD